MLNRTVIAAFLISFIFLAGCAEVQKTEISEEATDPSETSIVISFPETEAAAETTPAAENTPASTSADEGAKYISSADADAMDKVQGSGYIPMTPDQFSDPLLREYATKLYNNGYEDLIDMDYMGRCQAGFGLIADSMDYFNTGVDAMKIVSLGDDMGDKTLETCVIKMTEDQFVNIMLHGCGIEYYFSETQKDTWPEETDDGTVRRTRSENGNYIEYNRGDGVCIVCVDHSLVNTGETYYDD